MTDLLEMADRLWTGADSTADLHPFRTGMGQMAEVADATTFVSSFANVAAFATGGGLVLVDTGSFFLAADVQRTLRTWTDALLDTAVYTHGHVDHCFGVERWEAENADVGRALPRVVAHEGVPERFDRYRETLGYNGVINMRQFGMAQPWWPEEYRYPDDTYRGETVLDVGGTRFELRHARGETDDHTWVWVPDRKVLCTGDLFIWCSPNAGNPQKVQRYASDWAAALREMAELGAEVLLPGHGAPVVGPDRVVTALSDTAEWLESLHDQTLALMNEGATLDTVIHTVRPPAHLADKPYLQPVYDDPEFVTRNVWRLCGGWYDGNPAHLKPAREADLARELAALAGGVDRLAARAQALVEVGDDTSLRLASHLIEAADRAAPTDPAIARIRAAVYEARTSAETSLMAKGVFGAAARESRESADTPVL